MRRAPAGGGASCEGGANAGAGPAVLPHHADGAAHGAESRPALQAEDHPGFLPPLRWTGTSDSVPLRTKTVTFVTVFSLH